VYVTVVCDPAGRTAAYGPAPTADPPTRPSGGALACTAPLCPTSGLDRNTGRITDPNHIMQVDRTLAHAIATAQPSADLAGPLVAVLAHPGIRLLVVVGPFDSAETITKWWHWHANRLATAGVACLTVPLTNAKAGTR
jgi:hypothetical protein